MQLEWNRFIEGIRGFKEEQGMLWILCVVFLVILWSGKILQKHELFVSCAVLGACVICPITAVVLLKGFTPFYNWLDLQQLFPLILLIAVLGTEFFFYMQKLDISGVSLGKYGKAIISGIILVALLSVSTAFHGFDIKKEEHVNGIPKKSAEIFMGLQEVVGDARLVIAAPDEMLSYVRFFSADWHPVYGRDLWNAKSASYINSGYDKEYDYYDIFSKNDLTEERAEELTSLINDGKTDCLIIPDFWMEYIGETPEYESVHVTNVYIGIIKKELIIK